MNLTLLIYLLFDDSNYTLDDSCLSEKPKEIKKILHKTPLKGFKSMSLSIKIFGRNRESMMRRSVSCFVISLFSSLILAEEGASHKKSICDYAISLSREVVKISADHENMDSQYFNHITKLYLEKSKDHLGQLEDRKNNECGQSLLGKMVKDNIDRLEKLRFRIKNSNPEVSKNLVFSKPSSKAKKSSNRAFKQTSNKLTTSTGIVAVFCIIPTITFLTLTFSPQSYPHQKRKVSFTNRGIQEVFSRQNLDSPVHRTEQASKNR